MRAMTRNNPPVIGIRYPVWSRYWQTLLPGVVDYVRLHEPWRLQVEDNSFGEMESVTIDGNWRGDGLILFRATEDELREFRKRGQAVVLTSSEGPDLGYPRVLPNNHGIGRLAASHLLEKCMPHFAFLARSETLYQEAEFAPGFRVYPRERLQGFREHLAEHGFEPMVHLLQGRELWKPGTWKRIQADVSDFLSGLPKPCGLFVVDDALGAVVMRAAAELGIKVPADLAVLGFGNDPLFSMASVPALSSIVYPGMQIGSIAAGWIARQLAGEDCSGLVEKVPVLEVAQRGSSDTIATSDPVVASALAWIRRHAPQQPVTVAELEEAIGVSSTALSQKFRRSLSRSPKQEIMRVRLNHLYSLLSTTRAPVVEIARVMNFASAHELSRFFLNETGERPTSFRERMAENRNTTGTSVVIFDMDGTLLDTEGTYCRAYIAGMKRCGGSFGAEEYFQQFAGRDNAHIEKILGETLTSGMRGLLPEYWREEFEQLLTEEGVHTKPGVLDILTALRSAGVRLALASSSDRAHVDSLLRAAGLAGFFEAIIGGDEVPAGKPAPDLFLSVARRLAVLPASCLVVEDSVAGVRAAHAAGMAVVMVPDHVRPDHQTAELACEIAATLGECRRISALCGRAVTDASAPRSLSSGNTIDSRKITKVRISTSTRKNQ